MTVLTRLIDDPYGHRIAQLSRTTSTVDRLHYPYDRHDVPLHSCAVVLTVHNVRNRLTIVMVIAQLLGTAAFDIPSMPAAASNIATGFVNYDAFAVQPSIKGSGAAALWCYHTQQHCYV